MLIPLAVISYHRQIMISFHEVLSEMTTNASEAFS